MLNEKFDKICGLDKLSDHMYGIFLDLETSGLDNTCHRVLEIAFKIVRLETGEELDSYDSLVCQPREVWNLHDPVSIQVNGMSFERISQGTSEETVSEAIISTFQKHNISRDNAVFICQNPSFDRAFFSQLVDTYKQEEFRWPYHWLDLASMYWVNELQAIVQEGRPFPEKISLSKDAIAAKHGLAPEASPHRAINGVEHLILCYEKEVGWPLSVGQGNHI